MTVIGTLTFLDIEKIIPGITPGRRITTAPGACAVMPLGPGDPVMTRDSSHQPPQRRGRRDLTGVEVAATPAVRPARIAAQPPGQGSPERDLVVWPQHRMRITGPHARLFFGESGILVCALHLTGSQGVSRIARTAPVRSLHVTVDFHRIVRREQSWRESFQCAAGPLAGIADAQGEGPTALFPDLPLHNPIPPRA